LDRERLKRRLDENSRMLQMLSGAQNLRRGIISRNKELQAIVGCMHLKRYMLNSTLGDSKEILLSLGEGDPQRLPGESDI
jgi:hypothetical protein